MDNRNIAKLVILKIICCGIIFFLLIGGIGFVAGLSKGNIALAGIGLVILMIGIYKVSLGVLKKFYKSEK